MSSEKIQAPDPDVPDWISPDFEIRANRRSFIRASLLAIGVVGVSLSGCNLSGIDEGDDGPFFDTAHFAILDAVAETIMPRTDTPGARDAKVPERFDAMMRSWASEETRTAFTVLLDEVDAAAKAQGARGLAAMPEEKQLAVVAVFDQSKTGDAAYGKFKSLIFSLYYLSEPGATQELTYEHVPGAWEPSIPVTADTRAYAFDISV